MVRRAFVFMLIALLASQLISAQQAVTDSAVPQVLAEKIEPSTLLLVWLKDGTRVRGRLIQVTSDALHVQAGTGSVRTLPVAEIVSIERQIEGKLTRNIGKAVVYTLAGIGLAVLSYIVGLSAE